MTIRLDGRFWGPWIRQTFVPEIESLRDVMLNNILPALPDAEREADAHAQAMWDWAMAQPSNGNDDLSDWVEWTQDQGLRHYQRLTGVRQATLNMGTVMLWHLLEQQMLTFHRRQVLSFHEERTILDDPKEHRNLHTLKVFKTRLEEGGYDLTQFPAWKQVQELILVANAVKHGAGDSARSLFDVRPDLFTVPGHENSPPIFTPRPLSVERPAAGQDLYVTENDLRLYFTASIEFWTCFCSKIEE